MSKELTDNQMIAKMLAKMPEKQIEDWLNNVDNLERVLYEPPTQEEANNKHNQIIDKVKDLYKQMIHVAIVGRQKNGTIKLQESVLERWFEKAVLEFLESEAQDERD